MKSLLDDRFVPLTHQIGFLEGNFDTIVDVYLRWQRSLHGEVSSDVLNVPLATALQRLEPLTTPWKKGPFIATNSRWVAYFNNGLRVSDPESPISHLATIVPCRGLVVHCAPDRSSVTARGALRIYGAVGFTMFVAHQTDWLNQERAICAMNDGGRWVFLDQGIPQRSSIRRNTRRGGSTTVSRPRCWRSIARRWTFVSSTKPFTAARPSSPRGPIKSGLVLRSCL